MHSTLHWSRRPPPDEHIDSDLDLPVDLRAGTGLFALGVSRRDLEHLLESAVDIVPGEGLKPYVRAVVESHLVVL